MPGAGFKGKAREWKEAVLAMRDAPFEAVRQTMVGLFLRFAASR